MSYQSPSAQQVKSSAFLNQDLQKLHPIVKEILSSRGLSESEIKEHLSHSLKELPDFEAFKDLDKACDRLILALENNEYIGVYGDYDVDGTTSCALLAHFFKLLGQSIFLLQPGRFDEGYGVHPSSIDNALKNGVKVLITVDCGITNVETANYAKEKGLDLIITDHHKDIRESIPDAYAVINPNRRDEPEDSKLRALAGVGVAFALAWSIKKKWEAKGHQVPGLYPLLQFVAIGTICDVAKLTPLNLKLVRHGLKQMKETSYPGIKVFLSDDDFVQGLVSEQKLGFHMGPFINSKGRLEHPEMALQLLLSNDSNQAYLYYSQLEICNQERKRIQAQVYKEAKKMVLDNIKGGDHPISIVYAPHWHEGVVGIVASKLVEDFNAPAIVLTDAKEEGLIKGSARTFGAIDIFAALKTCGPLYKKFGGHKAAAGLTMAKDQYQEFVQQMNQTLLQMPKNSDALGPRFDLSISSDLINPSLVHALNTIGPFGEGNPRVVFHCHDLKLASFDILKEVHVKWHFKTPAGRTLKGISFNYIGKWDVPHPQEIFALSSEGQSFNAYFSLGINRFRGNEFIQLEVDKLIV